jgi:hypothetical protein
VGLRLALDCCERCAAAQRGEEDLMRERLHQITLALALPVTVAAVWSVRGEPAELVSPERATAYRVELAELPLPTPERLRAPRAALDWRSAPAPASEQTIARQRRAALPGLPAPQPVELAAATGSEPVRVAGTPPGVAQPELPLATRANVVLPPPPEPVVPTPPIVAARTVSEGAREVPSADGGSETVAAPETKPTAEAAAAETATPRYAALAIGASAAAPASAAPPALVARTSAALPAPALRPSVANAAAAGAAVREAWDPQRDHAPLAGQAGSGGSEKTWREGIAATPAPPVRAIRDSREPLDLSLERSARTSAPLDVALPAMVAAALPQLRSFAWNSTPGDSDRGAWETPLRLLDLPLPTPEVFARSSSDGAEEALPMLGSGANRFLPVLAMLAIPEPGSAALLGTALALLAAARRRERRA